MLDLAALGVQHRELGRAANLDFASCRRSRHGRAILDKSLHYCPPAIVLLCLCALVSLTKARQWRMSGLRLRSQNGAHGRYGTGEFQGGMNFRKTFTGLVFPDIKRSKQKDTTPSGSRQRNGIVLVVRTWRRSSTSETLETKKRRIDISGQTSSVFSDHVLKGQRGEVICSRRPKAIGVESTCVPRERPCTKATFCT